MPSGHLHVHDGSQGCAPRRGGPVSQFAFAALVVSLAAIGPPAIAAGEIKHVLVIYSNDRLEPANVEVDSGFREALAESDPSALVDAEFLDMPGFDEEAYHSALVTFLRTKYSRKVPDVIVAAGEEAIDFMLRDRSKLFPLVPIVHEGVAKWFLRGREPPLPADVVGVPVDYDFAATIEQAVQWRQQARRLVLVTGASPSDQLVEAELRNVVSRFKDRVKIEFLTGLPTSAVLKRLGQLADDAVVFTPGYYQDGEGRSYTPRESARIMASAATAPVFGPFNTFMGTGIVGGVMPSFRDVGLQAGVAVGRLLKGEGVASLNLPEIMPGTLNVDWRQLSRWGIPASAVPSGAIVQFREPSLWERYPHELIIITIAFLLLIGLVTGLIIERQRRRRAESAEAKNRSDVIRAMRLAVAGELSGSIAHEIAQPLGAILNNVDAADLVLESGGDNRDELRAIHSDIRRDNQRASEVIRRLRSLFAKHENERRPFKLDGAMSDVADLLIAEAGRRGIALKIRRRRVDIIVLGDRIEIGQVLINLALNAMDAVRDESGDRRSIQILIDEVANRAVISVRDRGHGIGPEQLPNLFQSFFTSKPGGFGLGLSIVRTIVEAHGGRVWAEKGLKEGATFIVELPIAHGAEILPTESV
jgi:signal transduction histidine kinase